MTNTPTSPRCTCSDAITLADEDYPNSTANNETTLITNLTANIKVKFSLHDTILYVSQKTN